MIELLKILAGFIAGLAFVFSIYFTKAQLSPAEEILFLATLIFLIVFIFAFTALILYIWALIRNKNE